MLTVIVQTSFRLRYLLYNLHRTIPNITILYFEFPNFNLLQQKSQPLYRKTLSAFAISSTCLNVHMGAVTFDLNMVSQCF